MRYGLEDLLTEPLPELDHSFLVARGAEVAAFAREGQKILVIAVLAFDAGKAIVEDAAIKIAVYHPLHIRAEETILDREALGIDLLKSLKGILDASIILGILPILPLNALWVASNFPGHFFSEVASDPALLSEAQIWARERIGYDWLDPHADPLYIPEAFGCKVRFLKTGPLIEPLPIPVTCLEDMDKIPMPDVRRTGRLPVILETAERLGTYGRGRIPVVAPFEGPFTTTCRILEAETIMRMSYRNPQVLEALLDRMTEFLVAFGRALIERGPIWPSSRSPRPLPP